MVTSWPNICYFLTLMLFIVFPFSSTFIAETMTALACHIVAALRFFHNKRAIGATVILKVELHEGCSLSVASDPIRVRGIQTFFTEFLHTYFAEIIGLIFNLTHRFSTVRA